MLVMQLKKINGEWEHSPKFDATPLWRRLSSVFSASGRVSVAFTTIGWRSSFSVCFLMLACVPIHHQSRGQPAEQRRFAFRTQRRQA